MPKPEESSGDLNGNKGGSGDQKIKVGEKEYSADDVNNLLTQAEAGTKASQQLGVVSDFMKKVGAESVEELVANVDGAYTVLNNLLEAGVINENGELVESSSSKGDKLKGKEGERDLDDVLNAQNFAKQKGSQKMNDLVQEALQGALEPLQKKLSEISDVQTSMLRKDVAREIQAKHPELDNEDVERVFGTAMHDKSKSIWQIAEARAESKKAKLGSFEEEFAKKYGLDLEELRKKQAEENDPNKVKQGGKEGGSSVLSEGKKITLRRGVKDGVHPKDLAKQYLEKLGEE